MYEPRTTKEERALWLKWCGTDPSRHSWPYTAQAMSSTLADLSAAEAEIARLTAEVEAKGAECERMTPVLREDVMTLLERKMAELSEEVWCAGWVIGWEEMCPRDARAAVASGGDVKGIGLEDAKLLCRVADALGHWVDHDGNAYHPKCDNPKGAE